MPDPRSYDLDVVASLNVKLTEQTNELTAALREALDTQARLTFATQVVQVAQDHPDAHTIGLTEWSEDAEEGEPFDMALAEIFDADGDELGEAENYGFGAWAVSDEYTLDPLRVDPKAADGELYHPGARISVAATLSWLDETLAQHPDVTDEETS